MENASGCAAGDSNREAGDPLYESYSISEGGGEGEEAGTAPVKVRRNEKKTAGTGYKESEEGEESPGNNFLYTATGEIMTAGHSGRFTEYLQERSEAMKKRISYMILGLAVLSPDTWAALLSFPML